MPDPSPQSQRLQRFSIPLSASARGNGNLLAPFHSTPLLAFHGGSDLHRTLANSQLTHVLHRSGAHWHRFDLFAFEDKETHGKDHHDHDRDHNYGHRPTDLLLRFF